MKCELCDGVALWQVGKKGFCRAHKAGAMAKESTEFRKVQDRANALRAWLRENSPTCFDEQKHLEEGSQERVYWHYGYMVALRDVMRLMTGEPVSSDSPELGKSSSSSAA